jgi:Tfp pilus assembly protein PilN
LEYRQRRKIRLSLFTLSLIVLSLLGWEGVEYRKLRLQEEEFEGRMERVLRQEEALAKEIRALGKQVDEASSKMLHKEVAFVNEIIDQKVFSWTQFLSDLEGRIPRDVAISRIQPTFATGLVRIGGTARSLKGLTDLMIQLQSDPMFEEVFLLDQKLDPKGPVADSVDFSIQFRYRRDQRIPVSKGTVGASRPDPDERGAG